MLGIDFTSAPRRVKPITVAVGNFIRDGHAVYALHTIRELDTLAAFEDFLDEPGPWLGGFDLPFSQPRTLIEHERWPDTWAEFVGFFCSRPREHLRETFRSWCNARPSGDKFAWRKADKPAGSSPAMRWTNPPVAWMMHAGIGRMLDAGLVFPAHASPVRGDRIAPGVGTARVALEAYPGFTARQVCRGSYKSDVAAMQTEARRANRRLILRALVTGTAGLLPRLELSETWRRKLVADGSGDLIDAVMCSLQAAHASMLPRYGLPADVDPLEGWIASVPPPSMTPQDDAPLTQAQTPPRSPPARPAATNQPRRRS